MNLKRLFLRAGLPALLIGGVGAVWHRDIDSNAAAAYLTAKVERSDVEDTVSALGMVQPFQYVDVGTQVTGQLKALHVHVGERVARGDLVAEIDPTVFASRVEMTKASLENAQALLSEKLAQHRLAQQQHDRNEQLYPSHAVSEEAFQQSAAAVDETAAQIEALQAQIKQIRAELKGDEANLRYTHIFAPMSGTVVSLTAREGQTLVASQQAPVILRIADLNTMTVWAQVSEADVPRIALRMPVYFTTLGLADRRWQGTVRQVLPTPENVNNVILYDVLFDVANPDQTLKPQMSAQTSFIVARAANALVVPVSALRAPAGKHQKNGSKTKKHDGKDGGRKYTVRVLKPDGHIEERQVGVGVISRFEAEVTSGIAEGEEVVVGTADDADKTKSKSKAKLPAGRARL